MRWILGFLVVVNLLVFTWTSLQSPGPQARSELPLPDIGNLRMINEQTSPGVVVQAIVAPSPLGAPEPIDADMSPVTSVEDASPAVAVEPAIDAVAVAETEPEPEHVSTPEFAQPADPLPEEASSVRSLLDIVLQCGRFGPFAEQTAAAAWLANLPTGIKGELTTAPVSTVTGYYVLVPPAATQEEAKTVLAAIRQAGVKDTWLFRSGELANAISLGLYSRAESAERFAKVVRAKGFGVELREKTRSTDQWWVGLRTELSAPLASRIMAHPGAALTARDCP